MEQSQAKTLDLNKNIISPYSEVIRLGNHTSKQLNDFFRHLQNELGCTYIFYIYEDFLNDKKIIYSSNWDWQNILVGEKLINDCPVFKAGTAGLTQNNSSLLLPWNNIHCKTSKEKEITLLRSEYNIANGIGISSRNGSLREGLGIGADIKDLYFYKRAISNNLIYRILKKIRLYSLWHLKYKTLKNKLFH